ncbi:uncharacterized protein LOC126993819 [Eriocheir sinensis]|uniref:uncharacterized protein LOC126993819 n=1 Tax=Eriocheir sinensis TaxID=95602 RepID=UPI0021C6FD2C|nr:uncharacterized protein LOC126993819 [Eriocheir sinensis]
MSSIQELVKLGRELGYDGDELKSFVSDEQARLRDERELERRNRKEKEEREREEREREREREEREREREREDREREREHALALELLKLQVAGGSAALGVPSVDFAARPKLPSYREGEDIASYFTRFERVATLLNIAKSSYAVHLGSLLTGKLAEFYTTLSEEVTGDYSQLKEDILKHSHRTSDHYRTAFRSAKINVGDTFQQFSTHLTRLFDHWLSASEVDHSFASLKSFMILDQFLASVSTELRLFLKENNVQTLEEAVKRADVWASAHHSNPRNPASERGKRPSLTKAASLKDSPPTPRKTPSVVRCHNCGQSGHIRPNCPQNPYLFKQKSKPEPTKESPKIGFCRSGSPSRQYYTSGTINGSRVSTIVRDTGCSSVLVSEEALPDADISNGKKVRCSDYLGRADYFPVVRCYLRCPYFDGWVDAIRAPLKFCTVLVGNIEGVRAPDDPDVTKACDEPTPFPVPSDQAPGKSIQAVQTRAATARKIHPLVLPHLEPLAITPQDFSKLQSSCPTLAPHRNKATTGEEEVTRTGSTFGYEFSDELLYRYVIELKDKLADCSKIAAQNSTISATRYKTYFDLNSQDRQFKPGDEVLVLLPDTSSKLLMA